MDIEFDLTKNDIISFNLYLFDHLPKLRRRRTLMRIGAPAVWVLMIVLLLALNRQPLMSLTFSWLPLTAITALWVLFFPAISRWSFKKSLSRVYGEGSAERFGKVRLSISRDAIAVTNNKGQTSTGWQAIKKVDFTDDHVFLLLDATAAHVVPKRAFADDSQFKKFIQTVQGYVQSARR